MYRVEVPQKNKDSASVMMRWPWPVFILIVIVVHYVHTIFSMASFCLHGFCLSAGDAEIICG